jgi:hypothetical protein
MKVLLFFALWSLWIQTFHCQDIIINVPQVNLSVNLGALPKINSFDSSKIQFPNSNSLIANSNFPESIFNFSGWMSYFVFLLLVSVIPLVFWCFSCCFLNGFYLGRW